MAHSFKQNRSKWFLLGLGTFVLISGFLLASSQTHASHPPAGAAPSSYNSDMLLVQKEALISEIYKQATQGRVIHSHSIGLNSHRNELLPIFGAGEENDGTVTYHNKKIAIMCDLKGHYGPVNHVRAVAYSGATLQTLTRDDVRNILGDANKGYPHEGFPCGAMQYNLNKDLFLGFTYNNKHQITQVIVTDTDAYLGS